jgi:hypothetical protein
MLFREAVPVKRSGSARKPLVLLLAVRSSASAARDHLSGPVSGSKVDPHEPNSFVHREWQAV